ncbi:MAG: hypothetical protein ABI683_06540 [Ginsengibacter sp.]
MNVIFSNVKKKKNVLPLILVVAGILMSFHRPISAIVSPAKLDLQIQHAPVIMPAVYKVYANDNALEGKYSLFKMLVTNNSNNTARNVEVSFEIPNYIEWKQVKKYPVILPGQSVVVNCYPSFDQKIVEKTTSSREKVNIKVTGSNIEETEQSFPIDIKGRNEFMYTFIPSDEIRTPGEYFDNASLLTCLVTPEDPIIKYYTQKIQEKVLKGEAASVENKDAEGVRFLTGIYYATLVSHMVYSGTSGVPAKVEDISSGVQSIRLPREVVTGKTGLCIELSILYASIMMNAGLDPIIYLIPGHAYPGFKMNGHYYAIEATGIGGEGMATEKNPTGRMTTQQALEVGMKEIDEFIKGAQSGDDRYKIIDVRESIGKGAVAMELKDDQYLRQKIDEIAQSFEPGKQTVNVNPPPSYNDGSRQNNGGNSGNDNGGSTDNGGGSSTPSGYKLYQGATTFAYPSSWGFLPKNAQSMPQLKQIVANSNNTAYVEVYQFSGYNSAEQAMSAIQQYVSNFGASLNYTMAGQTNSGFTIFNGQTTFNGGGIVWMAAFKKTGNGVAGIAAGANTNTGTKYQSTILKILNTIR